MQLQAPAVPGVAAAAETCTNSQLVLHSRLVRSQSSACVRTGDLTKRQRRTCSADTGLASELRLIGSPQTTYSLSLQHGDIVFFPDQK